MTDANANPHPDPARVPVHGAVLVVGIPLSAAAMLTAASLGWTGVAVVVGFVMVGCAVLLHWAR